MRGRRDPINRLRSAIDCLPVETRRAMLDGVRRQDTIIVGAYTDGHGGVCPMLAAHRNGSRVSFLPFARAWDAYSRATRPRPATPREVATLEHLLERSLHESDAGDLATAIAEHRRAVERRETAAPTEIVARRIGPAAADAVRRLRPSRRAPRERERVAG